jgi:hypothetical protein
MQRWAKDRRDIAATRDPLVRSAYEAGFSKRQIHVLTGIARTTINSILESEDPQ